MAEELGTRDVLEQVDKRLGNIEQDLRAFRDSVDYRFDRIDGRFERIEGRFERIDGRFERIEGRFERIDGRFESQTRWLVGLVLASWMTLMASIWLKL